ncbi:MAG TPA: cation diffusion facilitator family transporter [Acidimicrobiales bacterium]|nr:cation diffusion facilitator family transporter [Acidimicrobiales bacterium]
MAKVRDGGHHHHERDGSAHDHADSHHRGLLEGLRSVFVPHNHDPSDSIASALSSTADGIRALKFSLAGLAVTAAIQLVVVMATGSVGLLSDTIHNFADALTAVPLGVAFLLGRRPPNQRYTYGYGRAEDLAGIFIVAVIAASSVIAAWEAILRISHPRTINGLGWVAAAGVVGFAGNELVARYRIRVGLRIGSAALVADGRHARTDGFTSLAVVIGAIGVAAGWKQADPVVGLLITVAVLIVLKNAARDIYRRLMDSVDPSLVDAVRDSLAGVEGVTGVDRVRIRWVGHELLAEADISAEASLSLADAHAIAEHAEHQLLHDIPRLARATIHVNPSAGGASDPHRITAHHHT